MKPLYQLQSFARRCFLLLACLVCSLAGMAQLSNGGMHARFGVDADTRAGFLKYGPVTGNINSDDWFGNTTGLSIGLIDTTNASYYKNLLQTNKNIAFIKKMSYPLYTKLNGVMLMEAVYSRDYICQRTGVAADHSNDTTSFTIICKNGDDPANWRGGVDSVPTKNDFVDVYAHLRRNGLYAKDSLWFFTGVSTLGTTGNRHFDVELFKNVVTYTRSTGLFTTGGPSAGHTEWLFDASGNITQTGDLIISVSYSPGSAPVIDVRIWVTKTTYLTTIPSLFNFGANFDGATPAALIGYANIVSKSGNTVFGSGIANYSATPANDTTFSTPWGTRALSGLNYWSPEYSSLQHVEIGINMTRIGIDPALYTALGNSACDATFQSIFFKSRSSNSFTSNLQDFVGTLIFQQPALNHTVQGDTMACNQNTATFRVTSNTTAGYYTWQPLNGGTITSSNSDSSIITVGNTGSYVLSATAANGCTVVRKDTLTVLADSIQPVATADYQFAAGPWQFQLLGGDTTASQGATPYGASQGFLWNWSGPDGFTSTLQNPYVEEPNGTYQLILTELRNGCRDTATVLMNFMVLGVNKFKLYTQKKEDHITLKWEAFNKDVINYIIERKSAASDDYQMIANQSANAVNKMFEFNDRSYLPGTNHYRIKAIMKNGSFYYSNIAAETLSGDGNQSIQIYKNANQSAVYIRADSEINQPAQIILYSNTGQLIGLRKITLNRGSNTFSIEIPAVLKNKLVIVAVKAEDFTAVNKIVL